MYYKYFQLQQLHISNSTHLISDLQTYKLLFRALTHLIFSIWQDFLNLFSKLQFYQEKPKIYLQTICLAFELWKNADVFLEST